jgi:hypothetical protein
MAAIVIMGEGVTFIVIITGAKHAVSTSPGINGAMEFQRVTIPTRASVKTNKLVFIGAAEITNAGLCMPVLSSVVGLGIIIRRRFPI